MASAPPPAPVGPWGILVAFLAAQIGGSLLIAAILGLLAPGTATDHDLAAWAVRLTYGLSSLALLLATLAALRLSRAPAAGVRLWAWPGAVPVALGLGAGLILKLAGDLAAVAERPFIGTPRSNNPLVLYPHAFARPLLLTVLLLAVAVVAPMAEELFFRGLLYGWLRSRLAVLPATVLGAVLFALAHGQIGLLPPLLVAGAGLCVLYERSRTLWVPVAAHAAINASSLLLALWLH